MGILKQVVHGTQHAIFNHNRGINMQ